LFFCCLTFLATEHPLQTQGVPAVILALQSLPSDGGGLNGTLFPV
jgi:hypothetical protein